MSIEKKSLISTLKTTKKANVAAGPEPTKVVSKMVVAKRQFAPKRNTLKREVLAKRGVLAKREVLAKRARA